MSSLEALPKPDCYAALNCEVMLMSKLTVQEFVTIDGFAAAPDGAFDFMPAGGRTPADPQIERAQLRFIKDEVDTMLLGRTTYLIHRLLADCHGRQRDRRRRAKCPIQGRRLAHPGPRPMG